MKPIMMLLTIALITFLTRVLPFLLFPKEKKTPDWVLYLGDVLPFAVIAMLIVYCLKDISLTVAPYGIRELLAVLTVVFIHLWKKNTFLSIASGTILYLLSL